MDLLADLDPRLHVAKKTNRYIAAIIDYALLITVYIITGLIFGEHYTEGNTFGVRIEGLPALVNIAVWFVLFPGAESINGQTIGKMIMRVKVVKLDFSKSSFGNNLVRHLFDIIDYFPFFGIVGLIVASNNNLKQRVGDLVAKTIVIYK